MIQTIPELRAGTWRLISYQVTEVREESVNRIVFLRMLYEDLRNQSTKSIEVVAKVYAVECGLHALEALQKLWNTGFQAPSRYRVTRPKGYSLEQGTLFQAKAPGVPWADLLGGDETAMSEASARAAAWLIRLQKSALPDIVNSGHEEGYGALVRRVTQELISTYPRHLSRLQPAAERLVTLLPSDAITLVPSHGDFHPENVFLTSDHKTVIDFDRFGLREAAYDVGYAMGQLLFMSYIRLGDFAPGAQAALAFWRHYSLEGCASWTRVAVQVARLLFQSLHYELCILRSNPPGILERVPKLIEDWFAGDGLATLEELSRCESTPHPRPTRRNS